MNDQSSEATIYYTGRHLLEALQQLDAAMLDMPLVLVHGKELHKPNLVQGLIPAPVAINRAVAEAKNPSLLAFGQMTDEPLHVENGNASLTSASTKHKS